MKRYSSKCRYFVSKLVQNYLWNNFVHLKNHRNRQNRHIPHDMEGIRQY